MTAMRPQPGPTRPPSSDEAPEHAKDPRSPPTQIRVRTDPPGDLGGLRAVEGLGQKPEDRAAETPPRPGMVPNPLGLHSRRIQPGGKSRLHAIGVSASKHYRSRRNARREVGERKRQESIPGANVERCVFHDEARGTLHSLDHASVEAREANVDAGSGSHHRRSPPTQQA